MKNNLIVYVLTLLFFSVNCRADEAKEKTKMTSVIEESMKDGNTIIIPELPVYPKNIELQIDGKIVDGKIIVTFQGKGSCGLRVCAAYSEEGKNSLVIDQVNEIIKVDLQPLNNSSIEFFVIYSNDDEKYYKTMSYPLPAHLKGFSGDVTVDCLVNPIGDDGKVYKVIDIKK